MIRRMDIILIDDEPDTHEVLGLYLGAHGFKVHSAYSGADGLALMNQHHPDLVILDVLLPQLPGWEVCERIRAFSDVPIMMISALADQEDVIHGLDIGADDYLSKPLKLGVLRARINALLRRSALPPRRQRRRSYVDAHLMINLDREEVYVGGERVQPSALEYRLLSALVESAGYAVPTAELVEELWSGTIYEDYARYVRIYIGRLREIIEPDPRNPCYIVTEYGFGYRFVPRL